MSLCLSPCLSPCLSHCLSLCCLPVCLSVGGSAHLSTRGLQSPRVGSLFVSHLTLLLYVLCLDCLTVSPSVCPPFCLSVGLCPPFFLYVYPLFVSLYLSRCMSPYLSLFRSLSVCLYLSLTVCLCVCLSVGLSLS